MADDTVSGGAHDRRGRFAPGNNMRAAIHAKRQKGMSRLIGEATQGGKEIIEGMLEIARDTAHRDRYRALDWLAVRWAGKPMETVHIIGGDGNTLLAGLTLDDLKALASRKVEGE